MTDHVVRKRKKQALGNLWPQWLREALESRHAASTQPSKATPQPKFDYQRM